MIVANRRHGIKAGVPILPLRTWLASLLFSDKIIVLPVRSSLGIVQNCLFASKISTLAQVSSPIMEVKLRIPWMRRVL